MYLRICISYDYTLFIYMLPVMYYLKYIYIYILYIPYRYL